MIKLKLLEAAENITAMRELNIDMSKLTFLTIVTLVAAILFPSVIANTFAKSSDGDSDGGSGNDDKPKTSGYKKGDDGGSGGMPVQVCLLSGLTINTEIKTAKVVLGAFQFQASRLCELAVVMMIMVVVAASI
jgi:hypothetical protein